jgi:hypothetical protein
MNSQIKEKWIAALRSNEYKQAQGYLHTNEGFCCLGVLCDLYAEEKNMEWKIENDGNIRSFDGKDQVLPQSVSDWSGVRTDIIENPTYWKLVDMNDSGEDFSYIAEYIRENL